MKLLTIAEANEALTDVAARYRKIQTLNAAIGELKESALG